MSFQKFIQHSLILIMVVNYPELGKIKSINVFFRQIKNPGIALIHPFSDVFTAINQVGGIKKQEPEKNSDNKIW